MKTLSLALLTMLSVQTLNAATLDCILPSAFNAPAKHVKAKLTNGSAKVQLGVVAGYKLEAIALELGGQSVIMATNKNFMFSSASVAGIANLRLEKDGEVKEYLSNEETKSDTAFGYDIQVAELLGQFVIIASDNSLRISSASLNTNDSNLRIETSEDVFEYICKVLK